MPSKRKTETPAPAWGLLWCVLVVLVSAAFFPVLADGGPHLHPPKPGTGPTDISTMLANLAAAARYYYTLYAHSIEYKLLYYLKVLAGVCAIPIACQAFLKLLRQHEGGSRDFFWWFGRVAVCFGLISGSTWIVSHAGLYGRLLASGSIFGGSDGGTPSYLGSLVIEQQKLFNDNFVRFQVNSVCVKVDGKEIWINPDPANPDALLAVLEAKEFSAKDLIEGKSNWSFAGGIKLLNVARGLLELADFSLMYLSMALFLAFRLISPIAAVVAIDRQFAERFSKPIAWGGFVFLVVQPFIAQVFRLLAYSLGNTALYAVLPPQPLYTFDPKAMIAVGNQAVDPTLPIYFLAVSMLVCAGLLMLSYWVAYRFSKGEVLESITSTVQGWMLSGAAAGVATVSGEAAAGLQQQAQQAQLQGTAEAGLAEAKANRTADQETTRANWMHQNATNHAHAANQRSAIGGQLQGELMGIAADNHAALAGIEANRTQQNYMAGLVAWHAEATNFNQMMQGLGHGNARRQAANDQAVQGGIVGVGSLAEELTEARLADRRALGGQGGTTGGAPAGPDQAGRDPNRTGMPRGIAHSAGAVAGGVLALSGKSPADLDYELSKRASEKYYGDQAVTDKAFAERSRQANDTHAQTMTAETNDHDAQRVAAAQARAAGAMAGVNREESMMIEANRANYEAQVTALGLRHDARQQALAIQRHAGEEAAGLQRDASRMTLLGQQLAKQIESMNFRW